MLFVTASAAEPTRTKRANKPHTHTRLRGNKGVTQLSVWTSTYENSAGSRRPLHSLSSRHRRPLSLFAHANCCRARLIRSPGRSPTCFTRTLNGYAENIARMLAGRIKRAGIDTTVDGNLHIQFLHNTGGPFRCSLTRTAVVPASSGHPEGRRRA